MSPLPNLSDCWAKTDPLTKLPALSVQDHCLHVGAVAGLIQNLLPPPCQQLLPSSAALLAALHDIGKITPGFQKKSPHWPHFPDLLLNGLESNHAKVSQHDLNQRLLDKKYQRWTAALGGHHGRYCSGSNTKVSCIEGAAADWAVTLRTQLFQQLTEIFGLLHQGKGKPLPERIHYFTGFIIFCDWLGSNTDFFPSGRSAASTLPAAQTLAQSALKTLHHTEIELTPPTSLKNLIGFPPHPLQKILYQACDAPGLYLVEATMGTGKTEAALAAATRRWHSGEERGLYFALPTQLTSNRIHERLTTFLETALTSTHPQSLVHSSAWLSDQQTLLIRSGETARSDAQEATRWFSSSRRALLAPFGVGTIDQALLSILPVKHAALRSFALGGKVIILDEVHSYDDYTFTLLCRFVTTARALGSTIIILSATLTADARHRLITTAGGKADPSLSSPAPYPLITAVQPDQTTTYPVPPIPQEFKDITLHPTSPENALPLALEKANAGACVLIIKNTVKEAQETYDTLKSEAKEGLTIGLLHSRFPRSRREELEREWVQRLSKHSSKERRQKSILVSTQIVEQSVDLDTDILLTDLAPVDLILQSLGRLHRHQNTPRAPIITEPQCYLLLPNLTESKDPKILRQQLGPSAHVYPPHSLLRAHHLLRNRPKISLPDDIRPLLEAEVTFTTQAALTLQEDLNADIRKKLDNALRNTGKLIQTIALNDSREATQTRWNIRPSAQLILLACLPERNGPDLTLTFPDGKVHTTSLHQPFDVPLAKLLHLHAAPVPGYTLQNQPLTGDLLPRYFFEQATFAILENRTGGSCHLPDAPEELPYHFHYTTEKGVTFQKNKAAPDFWQESGADFF